MREDADKQTVKNGGGDGRDGDGRFTSGNAGGPGSPAGSPNKVTASMRELVERSIHERNPDGALAWLNSLPDSLFVRLAAKLLPPSVKIEAAAGSYDIQIVNFADMSTEELERLAHATRDDGLPAGQRSLQETPGDAETDTAGRP